MIASRWTPPPGFVAIADAAKIAGISIALIRVWQVRHNWPCCIRNPDNNYRYFSPVVVQEIKRFISAGKPIRELQGGSWVRSGNAPKDNAPEIQLEEYRERVDHELFDAARRGDRAVVLFYLASLGRMRPEARAAAVACIVRANEQLGGRFSNLLDQFIRNPQRLAEQSARAIS